MKTGKTTVVDADQACKLLDSIVAVHICHGTYFLDGRGRSGGAAVNYDPELTSRLYHSLEADRLLAQGHEPGTSFRS